VKVDVTGLARDAQVCIQTETVTATGTTLHPASPPYPCAATASEVRVADDSGVPITNDLLRLDAEWIAATGERAPLDGALVLVSARGRSQYPVSAFVGEGIDPPGGIVNLQNLFGTGGPPRRTLALQGREILEVEVLRGLTDGRCGLDEHRLFSFRRVPEHEEIGEIGAALVELEAPASCFPADALCDGAVDIGDVQQVANFFLVECGTCSYNEDVDVLRDCAIDIGDIQSVANFFGESEPFLP
jgi:hypothetical protein